MSDMGTFRTNVMIENPLRRGEMKSMPDTLVDTGAELTWAPRELRGPRRPAGETPGVSDG